MSSFLVVGIGILVVLGLIIFLRVNAFIALIVAALVVSFLASDPLPEDGSELTPTTMKERLERVGKEFGSSAGKIGLVIGFAAVIGEAMMRSGAADRIVMAFLSLLGIKRAPWALMGSGFVLSVPVFFDTVFYLLVPLARSLYANTKKNFLLYVLAISAGGAITHTLVPPTPGPLFMADALGVSVGMMMLVGGMVALPAAIAGIFVAGFLDKRVQIESLEDKDETTGGIARDLENAEPQQLSSPIPLWEALLPVVLPVLLISADTLVDTLKVKDVEAQVVQVGDTVQAKVLKLNGKNAGKDEPAVSFAATEFSSAPKVGEIIHVTHAGAPEDGVKPAVAFKPNAWNARKPYSTVIGNPGLVLLLSMTLALITWVRWKKPGGKAFGAAVETALLSGGLVILITAAGGAFGAMLKLTGVGADIKELFQGNSELGMTTLFLAFGMAALLKVAQGSSTTAMITVSGMMASFGMT